MTQLIRMVRTSESALVRTVVVECLNRITAKHFSRVYVFLPSVIQVCLEIFLKTVILHFNNVEIFKSGD